MGNVATMAPGHDPETTYIYVNKKCVSIAAFVAIAPAATTVDARGCTGLTTAIFAGQDRRGYVFMGLKLRGEWRILAGCRNFSAAQARKHWGLGSHSDNPAECLALAEKIIAEAERRDAAEKTT